MMYLNFKFLLCIIILIFINGCVSTTSKMDTHNLILLNDRITKLEKQYKNIETISINFSNLNKKMEELIKIKEETKKNIVKEIENDKENSLIVWLEKDDVKIPITIKQYGEKFIGEKGEIYEYFPTKRVLRRIYGY